jgi:hypothetical protein
VKRFHIPPHLDDRGQLVAVESHTIGYVPKRSFVVTASPVGAIRGDHTVPCRQTIVLVTGTVTVWLGRAEIHEEVLTEPGDALDLDPGDYIRYRLGGPESTVLILAAENYVAHRVGTQ